MALAEKMLFADPVLQRIFLSDLLMCHKSGTFVHYSRRRTAVRVTFEAELNCLRGEISELKVHWYKAKNYYELDGIRLRMRDTWLKMRWCSDGYFLRLPSPGSHVVMFSDGDPAKLFPADLSKLAQLRIRHTQHQQKARPLRPGVRRDRLHAGIGRT